MFPPKRRKELSVRSLLLGCVVTIALILVLNAMGVWSGPTPISDQERITQAISEVDELLSEWQRLESDVALLAADGGNSGAIGAKQARQDKIVGKMRSIAVTLPPAQVPEKIQEFLRAH